MRPVIILLAILTILLGVVYLQQRRTAHDQLTAAQEQTRITSDALTVAQADLTTFKVQQASVVTELKQQAASLETAKTAAEEQRQQAQQQTQAVKQELADARKTVQEQKDQLAAVEKDKGKLAAESADTAEQLRAAKRQLAAQEKAPTPPPTQPIALPDQQTRLELASCQARWNNLDALRDQVRLLKKQLRDERIAAWKRATAVTGNRGILLHDGQWYNPTPVLTPSP